jgi:hypothetical protein
MSASKLSLVDQRRLVEGWREAGLALQRIWQATLASQTAEESRQAAFEMLQLGGMLPADSALERSTGMVEMQRVFARGHGRQRP